jgi:transcriptional regulator with XRE-family HTH domain
LKIIVSIAFRSINVDTAPNYIAMIETGKRFPTDTMLEKIASALQREPFELFSITPVQKQWQEALLAELVEFITLELCVVVILVRSLNRSPQPSFFRQRKNKKTLASTSALSRS